MDPEPDPNDPTPGMAIWGWMTPVELRWLGEQAARMRSVVEVYCAAMITSRQSRQPDSQGYLKP